MVVPGLAEACQPCPALSDACATPSWPKKFVAFVRPGMGGELDVPMALFSAQPGWWPLGHQFVPSRGWSRRLWKGPRGRTMNPIPLRSGPNPSGGYRLPETRVRARCRRVREGRGAGPSRGFGESPERGRICLRAWYLAGPLQPLGAPRDSCRRQGQAPGTQPQGCCPWVSRFRPRRTEPGSRVRKKPDPP